MAKNTTNHNHHSQKATNSSSDLSSSAMYLTMDNENQTTDPILQVTINSNENSDQVRKKKSFLNQNDDDHHSNGNHNEQRDQWGGQVEFLLACLGNAVGLGNCWRFPYLCYKNGGGAFLIPYMVCCLIIGLPLFLIELGLGQFSAMGPGQLWSNLSPLFRGVGLASIICSAIVAIYYNMIIAWTLFYFVESFLGQKWQYCHNSFNSEHCFSILNNGDDHNYNNSMNNMIEMFNGTSSSVLYTSRFAYNDETSSNRSISSTEEFFNDYVLTKSFGLEEITEMNWKLVGALFLSWCLVAMALIKGIQSSGKVVYFTATFPYVILTILLARGLTLPGSLDGLRYYITPNWSRIYDVEVWRDAAIQVFYSFGIGGGGMITYASYNRFHNPVTKHALLVGVGDFLTSIFCGAVVFAMIGYMASALNKPIEQIVQDGAGLAFIVIPEGLSRMPVSLIWSVLFFTMLFLLGIDSQFAMVETVITYLFDEMRSRNLQVNKPLVVSVSAFCWFLLGLPLCTNAGIYIFTIMDNFSMAVPCLVIGLLEIFIITFIYGMDVFFDNLNKMTKWTPKILFQSYLVVMISGVAPAVLGWILYREIFGTSSTLTYGTYNYPEWANLIGWALALISIIVIPIVMVNQLFNYCCNAESIPELRHKSFAERSRRLVKPTALWWQNYNQILSDEKTKSLQNESKSMMIESGDDFEEKEIKNEDYHQQMNGKIVNQMTS